jgi:hypothetical protein
MRASFENKTKSKDPTYIIDLKAIIISSEVFASLWVPCYRCGYHRLCRVCVVAYCVLNYIAQP